MEKVDETPKFLEKSKMPKYCKKEIKNLSRPVTTYENGSLIKYLHLRGTLGGKAYWTVNKMKISWSELCEKTVKQEKLPKLFSEVRIAMISKSIKSSINHNNNSFT